MLSDMLSALMPNARELVERSSPWIFDEESAANLALLHAVGVIGSIRECELALFFRGCLEDVSEAHGYVYEFAVTYPATNGQGNITTDSAVHATRRRLLKLVKEGLLNIATTKRTSAENLAGRYYWLTQKGTRRVLDAGYRVRSRQNIDNMSHIGSVQDQHRLLEQQYIIASRLINPTMRVWGEYAIRSGLARCPELAVPDTKWPTVKKQLMLMSSELYLTTKERGDSRTPDTEANRLLFTRRPDALLLNEQPERDRYREATGGNLKSRQPHVLGDIEWVEIEASKKDRATQEKSFNGLFYLGRMLDVTLERGLVAKVTLVTRNHPHTDLRAKLLDTYERWLAQTDVQAMLEKKAKLTRGFDLERLHERLWLAEVVQDSEHRMTGFRLESVASIFMRKGLK